MPKERGVLSKNISKAFLISDGGGRKIGAGVREKKLREKKSGESRFWKKKRAGKVKGKWGQKWGLPNKAMLGGVGLTMPMNWKKQKKSDKVSWECENASQGVIGRGGEKKKRPFKGLNEKL